MLLCVYGMEDYKGRACCTASSFFVVDKLFALKYNTYNRQAGLVRTDYEDYKSYFLAGGIYNVFLLWLMNGCTETPEELADRMNDILIK